MATIEEEIDALYQLPPTAFTAARNELARRAGKRAAEVRRLARPAAAAWAINQLYWRRRDLFDSLAKASDSRRLAHVRQIGGKAADLEAADARHRAAMDAAFDVVVGFLRDVGDAVSPATVTALTRTLEAVPNPDINGRLTRAVEPVGFSALAALLTGPARGGTRVPADVVVMKPRSDAGGRGGQGHQEPDTQARAEAKRAAAARRRRYQRLTREVAAARVKEREAAQALARARKTVDRLAARVADLEEALDQARQERSAGQEAAERAQVAANKAVSVRVQLERQRQEIDE